MRTSKNCSKAAREIEVAFLESPMEYMLIFKRLEKSHMELMWL
jgi:hypothetical protein